MVAVPIAATCAAAVRMAFLAPDGYAALHALPPRRAARETPPNAVTSNRRAGGPIVHEDPSGYCIVDKVPVRALICFLITVMPDYKETTS